MVKRTKGKFWPQVRAMIWEKAQELYQQDEAKGMPNDFIGITATKVELREGGYFEAKLIVLRDLFLQKKLVSNHRKRSSDEISSKFGFF